MIQKRCDMHGTKMSKHKISNITNRKGEKTSIIISTWKEDSIQIFEKGTYFFKSFLSENAGNKRKFPDREINCKFFKHICSNNK